MAHAAPPAGDPCPQHVPLYLFVALLLAFAATLLRWLFQRTPLEAYLPHKMKRRFPHVPLKQPLVVPDDPDHFANIDLDRALPPKTGDKYAVIGVGNLGGEVAKMLLRRGDAVVGIDLAPNKELADLPNYTFVRADMRQRDALVNALQGVQAVIHTAALLRYWEFMSFQYSRTYDINVRGTQSVVDACIQSGVQRLVFVSSSTVTVGHNQTSIGVREDTFPLVCSKPENATSHYTVTKGMAEALVLQANAQTNPGRQQPLFTAAVRPASAVFGPRDGFAVQLAYQDREMQLIYPNRVMDYIFVENIAYAALLLDQKLKDDPHGIGGEAYLVSNDEPVTAATFFHTIKDHMPQIRVGTLPVKFLELLALFAEAVSWVSRDTVNLGKLGMWTRPTLFLSKHSFTFACDKARDRLGYRPIFSLWQGVQKTVEVLNKSTPRAP